MKKRTQYLIAVIIILVIAVGTFFIRPRKTVAPTQNHTTNANTNTTTNTNAINSTTTSAAGAIRFFTNDLPSADPYYQFSALIPSAWVGVYSDSDQSIEFYDPKTPVGSNHGVTILAQRYVSKSFAAAPQGVKATTMTIDGQTARSFIIKVDAAMHARVPAWTVGQLYQRVDVLGQKGVNSIYYTLSKGPGLTDAIFTNFLNSLDVQDVIQPQ